MMKMKILKIKLALLAGLLFSGNVLAASISDLINYLQSLTTTTAGSIAQFVYEYNPNTAETMLANLKQQKTEQETQNYAKGLAFCQIYNTLPRDPKAAAIPVPAELKVLDPNNQYKDMKTLCERVTQQNRGTNASDFKRFLSRLPATDTQASSSSILPVSLTGAGRKGANPAMGNNNLSFDSLMSANLYQDPKEKENALNFINFSGKLYETFPATQVQIQQVPKDNVSYINYQTALRSFVAAQSVALSNLYQMFADRSEQPEITKLGLKNKAGEAIKSPLQYREYLANRRANDEQWYEMVNSASSNTVNRENLMVLVEIQRSLERLEKTNERLLATMSVMQLQNLNNQSRPELEKLAEQIKEYLAQ
jgi:hypothetical protein